MDADLAIEVLDEEHLVHARARRWKSARLEGRRRPRQLALSVSLNSSPTSIVGAMVSNSVVLLQALST